jgi:hypothetical protein
MVMQAMKASLAKANLSSIILALSSYFLFSALSARQVVAQQVGEFSCQGEIVRVAEILTSTYGIVIDSTRRQPTTDDGNPFPNSETLLFVFEVSHDPSASPREKEYTRTAYNIMFSPVIRLGLASRILAKCDSISIVDFAIARSDFFRPTFRMPGGSPVNGVGIPCSANQLPLEWGFFPSC